jgi:hypothetical protein
VIARGIEDRQRNDMRIGILIKRFEKLPNWELRIINEILNSQTLELSLLIQDGRVGSENPNSLENKIKRLLKSKNMVGALLLKLQVLVERRIFKERLTTDKEEIISRLEEIDVVRLRPERRGFLDVFSSEDAQKIKEYDLDLILRHEFGIIRGPLLRAAKYGIWSFHHADDSINRGGPAGFWEILLKRPHVGVTLQQLTPELDGGLVIDKAFYNRHWSFVKTNRMLLEASVSVLFKSIRQLQRGNCLPSNSVVYYNHLYKAPSFTNTLVYMITFYMKLLSKSIERIKTILFGTRYGCWTLFIGRGEFMRSTLFRLRPVELPKREFWADPFILNYKGENYVFFENYSYKTKRGKISCGMIRNQELVNVSDVLVLDYHLSYPYVFEENGDIYLLPETRDNDRLELYRCVRFPDKWELYSTAFDGEKVIDAFFYDDDSRQKWLFVNKVADSSVPSVSELFIYKVESLKLDNLEAHFQNPVIISSTKARNGGSVFRYRDGIYRPSQANIDGIYGRALNINRIEKLTIDEYVETEVVTSYPSFHKGLMAMHHLHQTDGLFVIDAAFRKK